MSGTEPPKAPELWFNLLGVTVLRKTDLLAAAAFILSASTVAIQLYNFWRGPDVALYAPDAVYVFFDKYPNRTSVTRIAGPLSLTNAGDAGSNAILRDVDATVQVGKVSFAEHLFNEVKVARSGIRLDVTPVGAAHPMVVAGGSANGALISFAPLVRRCAGLAGCAPRQDFVPEATFLNALAPGTPIVLEFTGRLIGTGRRLHAQCRITLDAQAVTTLAENGWYTGHCVAPAE